MKLEGLRYCEAHVREAEAALRVDLGVRAHDLLRRWTEETEGLDNPLLAGLLRDAGGAGAGTWALSSPPGRSWGTS